MNTKRMIILVIVVILLFAASMVNAQYYFHEMTIQMEGEYKLKSISSEDIFSIEGNGKALIQRKVITAPDKPTWWELF